MTEPDLTMVLFACKEDARPQLLLQPLLVLHFQQKLVLLMLFGTIKWVFSYNIKGKLSVVQLKVLSLFQLVWAQRGAVGDALLGPRAVGVAVVQVHGPWDLVSCRINYDRALRFYPSET